MMKTSVIGFPRIGKLRELKFATEKYFRSEISQGELLKTAKELRKAHWLMQKSAGIDWIPSGDFSFYDQMLDMCMLFNVIPSEYQALGLDALDTYFAMARGYQGKDGDVKALAMKKWMNTNYHYLVPEFSDETEIRLVGTAPFDMYQEAKADQIETKPVLIGAFTFLKLAKYRGKKGPQDFLLAIAKAYGDILERFHEQGVQWVQFDEPILVTDLSAADVWLFVTLYQKILAQKGSVQVLLQTYFGDVRDVYSEIIKLDFDGIGLDFLEGKQNMALLKQQGFPKEKVLFAGLINGKNIWRCNYKKVLEQLKGLRQYVDSIVLGTPCSLLHVPYTLENEEKLQADIRLYFSFAKEKLKELAELKQLASLADPSQERAWIENEKIFATLANSRDAKVQAQVAALTESDFVRPVLRATRKQIQQEKLQLPLLPTTTIGSFPQTQAVKKNRTKYRKGEITKEMYDQEVYRLIADCIRLQEEIGLDVLVHGEYERNDMVEFFGENLAGYIFTEKAWVQSYGTRCVKPPIIFGDVKRIRPITVSYSKYAQSLTDQPVKGMLTGPVTILNWSFSREDISQKEMAFQIALAIRDEVADLVAAGLKVIQIDEAALKEKLPIRKEDWYRDYLDWAILAFRLCHAHTPPDIQIHTHMCYSEFEAIIQDIDKMDADVISFEASRSKLEILDGLVKEHFQTAVGPGVYDIHSPRVPSTEEMVQTLENMLEKLPAKQLWVNPDCGLKTRGISETTTALKNLVTAAQTVRSALK